MSYLQDGFSTIISCALNPSIKLKEKTVQPPGVSGGGPVEQTTMRNTAWRTSAPKRLKTMTAMTVKVNYDPAVYTQIIAMINGNQQITVTFSDGSTLKFYGWLDEFTPDDNEEGTQPSATAKFEPSNLDGAGAEAGPTYTTAGATTTTTTGV